MKTYFDKDNKVLQVNDLVEIQHCIGRYGQTRIDKGYIKSFDANGYSSIVLTLVENHPNVIEYGHNSCKSYKGGDNIYIPITGIRTPEEVKYFEKWIDFEHGHETWVRKVD